jgi:chlorophyll synthase
MSRAACSYGETARPAPAAVLELLKPITWFPPMWAFACGAVSSGMPVEGKWVALAAGAALAGPLICAASQAVNDWFDRHVDAINEPQRPIPSGRMPGAWGLYVAVAWSLASALVAVALGPVVMAAAAVGLMLAWAYSAPPIRLKRNGWLGNAAVAICYEGLPWITGAAVMGASLADGRIAALAGLYSIGAHGIMTLNDFKSIEGDRRMSIHSLPVLLGVRRAALTACAFMTLPQCAVIALLLSWGQSMHALAVAVLLAVQLAMMARFLRQPRERALWLSALGVNFYVIGMLVSAFALRAGAVA